MKLSKVLAASAVVSAMALTATVSALAADLTPSKPADGSVVVPVNEVADYVTELGDKDATYVVLLAYGDAAATFESDKFLQIGQGDLAELADEESGNYVFVIPEDLETKAAAAFADTEDGYDKTNVKVVVRIGGLETGFLEGVFAPFASVGPYADSTRKVGDVNGDEAVDVNDPGDLVLYLLAGDRYPITGDEAIQAADVNDDGTVDVNDPGDLVLYLLAGDRYPLSVEYIKDKGKFVAID